MALPFLGNAYMLWSADFECYWYEPFARLTSPEATNTISKHYKIKQLSEIMLMPRIHENEERLKTIGLL